MSPQLSQRITGMAALLTAGFLALAGRLFYIQVLCHEEFLVRAENNTKRVYEQEPRRGEIRDRNGGLLASSVFVKTVCADPESLFGSQREVARVLGPLLDLDPVWLEARMQPGTVTNRGGESIPRRYVVLKRKVRQETWAQIKEALASFPEGLTKEAFRKLPYHTQRDLSTLRRLSIFVDSREDQLRVYPNQTLAAHILGHVGQAEREINGRKVLQTEGKAGMEMVLDEALAGVPGWRETERAPSGRELVPFRDLEVAARPGLNVFLSIDAGVQHIVESELAQVMEDHRPISATAIVIDPRSGRVLGLANLPTFNPAEPGDAEAAERRNRAITDIAEPGSTFKIVVVSAALNENLVTLGDLFDCERGLFRYGGRTLRDHDPYGLLSVKQIIAKSSNIGSAKVGIRLGKHTLHDYIERFGFGTRTGLPLPGEVAGIVHPPSKWSGISITRIPMGHEVAVNPLQMVMAMAALANDGVLMRPMLIERLEDAEGRVVARYAPQPVRRVVGVAAARQMVRALTAAASEEGTGKNAMLDHYTVAGKTGTAQKAGRGGYLRGKYFSSFIGFFPADRPELCISVVLDEPHGGYYGGQTAAPVFKRIAERAANYLNVRPERLDEDTLARYEAEGVAP